MALSTVVREEIDRFRNTLQLLEQGAIDADKEFKPYRLVHGIYGQRQGGLNHMARIKLRVGRLTPNMMRVLASTSRRYSNGISHITTRQAIQFHYVQRETLPALMEELENAGMTTREACGNAVRGVVCSPLSGTRSDEPFNIEPYAMVVFEHFLRGPRSANLPRKFKIGLTGSIHDPQAFNNIQDIGIAAVVENGVQGFRIRAAGGLGSSPQAPIELYSCLPKNRLVPVCEAILRVHHGFGDRQNRAKARLKFVLRERGDEGFRKLFEEQLALVDAEGVTGSALPDAWTSAAAPSVIPAATGAEGAWRATSVSAHRQAGYCVVAINIPLGDLQADTLEKLAALCEQFSGHDAAVSVDQNLYFRHVQISQLSALYAALKGLGLARPANTITDVLSCPGASTCQLGVTLSKNMASELSAQLDAALAKPGFAPEVQAARIRISGCPNSCGQHHVGTIGLHGAAAKIGDKLVPHYVLLVGGGDGVNVDHAAMVARIPARKVVPTVVQLLTWYGQERQAGESVQAYLRRLAAADVEDKKAQREARKALKERLEPLFGYSEGELSESDLYDFGSEKLFSLDEIGAGECMA